MIRSLCKKQFRPVIIVKYKQLLGTYFLATLLVLSQGMALAMPGRIVPDGMPGKDGMPRKSRPKKVVKAEECPACEQIKALEQQVKELSQQLEATAARPVEDTEARRQISELNAQLRRAEERAAAAERANEQLRAETNTAIKASASATETKVASVAATQATTASQVEELSKKTSKVESTVERLGGFRFSGDFRLRGEALLRDSVPTALSATQPALAHVQTIRGRYRLRVNVDKDVNQWVSFRLQLASGAVNNPLTTNQDFTSTAVRHPFFISEAYADFHPNKWFSAQGGRLQEVFADNSRFLFDDDLRLNGFNEKFVKAFKGKAAGFTSVEFRAGQYIFTNPNVAIVTAANLGPTGAALGSTGRASYMFHQGLLFNQKAGEHLSQQFGGDIQIYRNPNQIQYASTAAGQLLLLNGGLGLDLSGGAPQTGNATTTATGSILSADDYYVTRLTYRLDHTGFKSGEHEYPVAFNVQVARNIATSLRERDSLLASFKLGNVKKRFDNSFLYLFAIKGANSMISQFQDDDLGRFTGVNIRTHHLRWDVGLGKGVQFQSLVFIQNQLRNTLQFPNFFVPVGAYAPRLYTFQEQIQFTF